MSVKRILIAFKDTKVVRFSSIKDSGKKEEQRLGSGKLQNEKTREKRKSHWRESGGEVE